MPDPDNRLQTMAQRTDQPPPSDLFTSGDMLDAVNRYDALSLAIHYAGLDGTLRSLADGFANQGVPGTGWLVGLLGQGVTTMFSPDAGDPTLGSGADDSSWAIGAENWVRQNWSPSIMRAFETRFPWIEGMELRINWEKMEADREALGMPENLDRYDANGMTRFITQLSSMPGGLRDMMKYAEIRESPTSEWRAMGWHEEAAYVVGSLLGPDNIAGGVAARLVRAGGQGVTLSRLIENASRLDMVVQGGVMASQMSAIADEPEYVRDFLRFLNDDNPRLNRDPLSMSETMQATAMSPDGGAGAVHVEAFERKTYGVGALQWYTNRALRGDLNRNYQNANDDDPSTVSDPTFRSMAITGQFSDNPDAAINDMLRRAATSIFSPTTAQALAGKGELGAQSLHEIREFNQRFREIGQRLFADPNVQLTRNEWVTLQLGLMGNDPSIVINVFGDSPLARRQTLEHLQTYVSNMGPSAFAPDYSGQFAIMWDRGDYSEKANLHDTYAAQATALRGPVGIPGENDLRVSGVEQLGDLGAVNFEPLTQNRAARLQNYSASDAVNFYKNLSDPAFLAGNPQAVEALQRVIVTGNSNAYNWTDEQRRDYLSAYSPSGQYDLNTSNALAAASDNASYYLESGININSPEMSTVRAARAQFDMQGIGVVESLVRGDISIYEMSAPQFLRLQIYAGTNFGITPRFLGSDPDSEVGRLDRAQMDESLRVALNEIGQARGIVKGPQESDSAYQLRVLQEMRSDSQEILRLNGGGQRASLSGAFEGPGAGTQLASADPIRPGSPAYALPEFNA